MQVNPIFYREYTLFRKKLLKFGFVFSSLFFPIIYLLAFGLGLSGRIQIEGTSYQAFLVQGIAAMTSMTNSYNYAAFSISSGRLYFKTFQVLIQSPNPPSSIMLGIVLFGMLRGYFAALVIIVAGALAFQVFPISLPALVGLALNTFLFAGLGAIVGMKVKDTEDNVFYTNFIIIPMAFFSGTFFPVDGLPATLQWVVKLLPLTHTNAIIRAAHFSPMLFVSLSVLTGFALLLFAIGTHMIKSYSE